MIGGIFQDNKNVLCSEKISNFYLPNKKEFDKNIGLDYSNRLLTKRIRNEEVVIFAQFCEIVGPMPLIVLPENCQMNQRTIDMIVLKAMSADYQCCEEGDLPRSAFTDILDADCMVPFFAHYFTLMDVYSRGYVRPCCVIVCCGDRVRGSSLFNIGCSLIKQVLTPFMRNNLFHFRNELKNNLKLISKILDSEIKERCVDGMEASVKDLLNFREEYTCLLNRTESITESEEAVGFLEEPNDELFYCSLSNSIRRNLRSIYTIMMCNENDIIAQIRLIIEILKNTVTPHTFSFQEFHDFDLTETYTPNNAGNSLSKYNLCFFQSAVSSDRIIHVINKFSSICCCRKSIDDFGRLSSSSEMDASFLFPNLIGVQGLQCQYVSNICQQLSIQIVTKLLGCIFQQCHLVVLVDSSHYFHLMMFLSLFLPKADKSKFIPIRNSWPSVNEMIESPISQINDDSRSLSVVPSNLKRFVAVYDAVNNKYVCGPEYNKGHLVSFLELFKTLNYNQCQLETLTNILLLSYFDLVYQWISMLVKRDRRWVGKYILEMGASPEDVIISERLALFVLQKLAISHQIKSGNSPNLFLITTSLFNSQCIKFCSKDKS